jgi:streptomycin 6-kinase
MTRPREASRAQFAAAIERAHPDVGRTWLRDLPAVQARLAAQWDLKLTDWLPARGAHVQRAVTADGREAVLKIPVIAADTVSERRALAYWDGDAAARLIMGDGASGALLVEWVDGRPFAEEDDTPESLRRAGEFLRDLHRPRAASHRGFPTLEEKLAPLRRSREHLEGIGGPRLDEPTHRAEAAALAWLAESATADETTVIHGDLHPRNVLVRPNGAPFAIDPYGVIGDRCRDAASLALFFREDDKALRRLETLADFAELPRSRVLAHAFALAVGSYRTRAAFGITAGRDFLENVACDLQRPLACVIGEMSR